MSTDSDLFACWRKVGIKAYSFFINLGFWFNHIPEIYKTYKTMKEYRKLSLVDLMNKFSWSSDSKILQDWIPWVSTIIAEELKDDCDGAAILAKWYIEENGGQADVYSLWPIDKIKGHSICVSNDKKYFVSNNNVLVIVSPEDWQTEVLKRFKSHKYEVIIKES